MVKRIELAVIFKRNRIDEYSEEFIPDRVIEGTYSEGDHCFLDAEDITYFHIAEPMVSGVGYANRMVLEDTEEKLTDEKIKNIKIFLLDEVSKFKYIRNRQHNFCIVKIDKENNDEYLFEDDETNILYAEYEKHYQHTPNMQNEAINDKIAMTPLELVTKVKETIKGQDKAVEKIVTSLWITKNFKNIKKKNMLVIGPTGVGKTAIFEKLKKVLGIPVTIFSVPGLSQAGYIGRSTDEILKQIYYECEEDIDLAENSIIILDEIDKLAFGDGKSGDVSTVGVQNELLKIIEGCERIVEINSYGENFSIDTSNIIFVCTGAFSELYEKKKQPIGFDNSQENSKPKINTEVLRKYGMKREFLGRTPVVVELNALTEEILKDIILNSDESEFRNTIDAIESMGVTIKNADEIIDLIAKDAISKGIGARGLVSTITNIFLKIFYEIASYPDKYQEVIIGKNILEDNTDFQLIPKVIKRRIRSFQV